MGPLILEKNKIDFDTPNVSIVAADLDVAADPGNEFVNLLRNRRNDSGWGTAGSVDSGLTTLDIDTIDEYELTDIFFIGMNFKAYTMQYWNGFSFADFSTPIDEFNNTLNTRHHEFEPVSASKFKITIQGTMIPNVDKLMAQLVMTRRKGRFNGQPFIKQPKTAKGRKTRKMLSGRSNVTRSLGAFSCNLEFKPTKDVADHALIESMFNSFTGFLVWLRGAIDESFFTQVEGFRAQDLYLMTCANELDTEWVNGMFNSGQRVSIQLVESRL